MMCAVEILRFGLRPGGDDIPAGTAMADQIERGEFAGDMIGLVIGRRRRGHKTNMVGHHGQRRQQRQRIEVDDVAALAC